MENEKIKVGDTLYTNDLKPCFVEKVGRKYFKIKGSRNNFLVDKLRYESVNYSQYNIQLFRTEKEVTDAHEKMKLQAEVKEIFRDWGSYASKVKDMSIGQLKQILAIVNEENPQK